MADVNTILSAPEPDERHSPHDHNLLELLRHGRRVEALERATNKDEVNQLDDGSTPLLVATTRGWGDVVEVLVRNGANVNVISDLGETPLMRAIKCGKIPPSTIKLILDHGGVETLNLAAKENAFFSTWTALHFACDPELNHEPAVIALLVAYGANTKAVAGNGKTPIEMCANHHEFSKALHKPRAYLKHHAAIFRPVSDDEERKSSEPMQIGFESLPDDDAPRSSLLNSALHMFSKPKKSSLLQSASLMPPSPVHLESLGKPEM